MNRLRFVILLILSFAVALAILAFAVAAPAQSGKLDADPSGVASVHPADTIKLTDAEALAIRDLQFKISQQQLQLSAIWQEYLQSPQGQRYSQIQKQTEGLQANLQQLADNTWKAHGVTSAEYDLDQDSWTLIKKPSPATPEKKGGK